MTCCIVSDRYRFIYLPVPNSASEALQGVFANPLYETYEQAYSDIDKAKQASYLTFSFLQDPIARLLAAYQIISMRQKNGALSEELAFLELSDQGERFHGFLKEMAARTFDPLVAPQSSFLRDVDIEFCGSFENLDQDVALLFSQLGMDASPGLSEELRNLVQQSGEDAAEYRIGEGDLDDAARTRVNQVCSEDLKLYYQCVVCAYARSGRLLESFKEQNGANKKSFAYRLGNRGFYAEISTVARAMLYCLAHRTQLVIDSHDFIYLRQLGWQDYFKPFCPDLIDDPDIRVDIDCHSNVRGQGTVFNELLALSHNTIILGRVPIRGFEQILSALFISIFSLNETTQRQVNKIIDECGLPERYTSVHIRRGDKVGDEDHYYPAELYLDRLEETGVATLPVFVLSDDFESVLEARAALRRRRSAVEVFTLCEAGDDGFDVEVIRKHFAALASGGAISDADHRLFVDQLALDTTRLLAETIVAIRSDYFVGTQRSNVSRIVRWLHDHRSRCDLLRPQHLGYGGDTPLTKATVPPDLPRDMRIARSGSLEFFLFLDIFVHWSGTKITAVAPYYGDDINWAQHGVDLESIILIFGTRRIKGRYITHRLDSWEPCVLFDFEDPALAVHLRDHTQVKFSIEAGPHCASFVLDTNRAARHEVAMSLIVQNTNRWLPYYLDYYTACLDVDHVYIYDNYTQDNRGMLRAIQPFVEQGKATYIPWHYRWVNESDGKQICQIPHQVHSLNKFGRCQWIGFFDYDEFLRIPNQTLKQFLSKYDPDKTDGLSFNLRWFMYKGESARCDIGNPLLCFFNVRREPTERKIQKVIASPRNVRFLRIHWLEDGKKDLPVDDHDIYFHHYYLQADRFEAGKTEAGTTRDDYMLGLAEPLIQARRLRSPPSAGRSPAAGDTGFPPRPITVEDWIEHVMAAFETAEAESSKLSAAVLDLPGYCGLRNRHFLNTVCAFDGCRYLEIGSYKGASLCAAMSQNRIEAVAIDNWSQFGSWQDALKAAAERHSGASSFTLIEDDCFSLDMAGVGPFDVYYYDGDHSAESHTLAIEKFFDCLADRAVVIIDDWNRESVRAGTRGAMADLDIPIVFEKEIILPQTELVNMPNHKGADTWWNGIYVMIVDKTAAPLSASSRSRALRSTKSSSVDPRTPIEVIIFSKDRAFQLDGLLRSMDRFFEHPHRTIVLYASSSPDYQRSYDMLSARHEDVAWRLESDFKKDVLDLVDAAGKQGSRFVMFLVDDIVFTRRFTGEDMLEHLEEDEDLLAVSLRLGENIYFCHPRGSKTEPPNFLENGRCHWRDAHPGYWDYPMSIDGNIYRQGDMVETLAKINFTNPNSFEAAMSGKPIDRPCLLCHPKPYLVNLALNLVQDMFNNPHGDVSAEFLNERYIEGYVIDIEPFVGGEYSACHIEPEIKLIKRSQQPLPTQPKSRSANSKAEQQIVDEMILPRRAGQFAEDLQENGFVLRHAASQGEIRLNAAARDIWTLCNGVNTVGDMVRVLSTRFDIDPDLLRADILTTIRQFEEIGLIQTGAAHITRKPPRSIRAWLRKALRLR
jgi:hypothetical protein